MIKDFSQTIILTSQNEEGFLNFRYESGDPSIYLLPVRDNTIEEGILYVNGLDIASNPSTGIYDTSVGYSLYIGSSGDPSIASFHIYTRELEDFSYNLQFYGWNNPTDISSDPVDFTIDVSVLNRKFIIENTDINVYPTSKSQIEDETSYLILRTNPKFTGNIKLNVDTSNNLYLDTFKISDILNNKKYRKQKVSGESVFSSDIRKTFGDMPLGELYRLDDEDTLNIKVPKTDLYNQYNLTYSYGARLFEDELYDDDYSLLAPLWINKQLPDYFAIFRLDGVYNEETYDDEVDLSGFAEKYLKNGSLIRSWGMKDNTPIGNYLRNHLDELSTVRSPLFLSLSDPTQKDPDPNTWYGIAVDRGIITGRSETPYFFDQKDNFTDTNAFISEGFERLNLLSPNLINMEYIFSDHDVSLYSMHRYFGLYLSENELYKISYYADNPTDSVEILSLDSKDSSIFFNSAIFDSSGNISDNYENRIFTINDIQTIKRITNIEEVSGQNKEFINEWLNKPGDNLFSTEVNEIFSNKFITFSINNLLSQGEHLRIIDKTNFKIWEVYGIKSELLEAGNSWTYASEYESDGYPTIYRVPFSVDGEIEDQIQAIKSAFDVFSDYLNVPFETTLIKEEKGQLSLEIKDYANSYDIWFQRLTAQVVDNPSDPSSNFNTAGGYNDLKFYGVLTPTVSDFERIRYDSSYGPINFELFGDRMSLTINFQNAESNHLYSFDASVGNLFTEYTMYMGTDKWYRLVKPFDISTAINHSYNYIVDPEEENNNLIVKTSNQINKVAGKWNAYSTYPITISLMGINPVKDMDFTVYDSSLGLGFESKYWYDRSDDSSTYYLNIPEDSSNYINCRNSYEITAGDGSIFINNKISSYSGSFNFNTFDGSAFIIANSNTTITYNQIDGSKTYYSYTSGDSEESINNYYLDPSTKGTLKYGLTVPYVTKWSGLGRDCRNNPFRLILDGSIFYDASTNFIPYENNFDGEISYPVYKYLNTGERAWESYVFYDINDVIKYSNDGSTNYVTFKELMFQDPYLDVFSKLIYSNRNINSTVQRSSLVYYNAYKDTIDSIINGLNISMFISENAKNTIDIKDWDKFSFSFISTPSKNRDSIYPIEVFINENTETILMVWYQGNDILNYNKRYSTYLGGKNVLDGSTGSDLEFQSFRTNDNFWSYTKTPFVVNNSILSADITNVYDIYGEYDSSVCSPFNQLNWNDGDQLYSIFNAYTNNVVSSYSFEFFDKQYNTLRQYVSYSYLKNSGTFGAGILNLSNNYMNNTNIYKDKTCNLEIFKEFLSYNNVSYFIFREDIVYTNNNFGIPPVNIVINNPRSYKGLYTYNGWFRPAFKNILDFKYNEEGELMNIVEKDFTFSNTNFKSYNDISQYWYNKVVEQVTAEDVSIKNAIGYLDSFNVFKSQWDSEYYVLDSSAGQSLIDGFNSTLELPSYFGSKLIKLPYSLELGNWDFTTASSTDGDTKHLLEFNLTRKIINMFKETPDFTDNWAALTTSDNVIDSYIKNTILGYYNISKQKIDVELWTKEYDGTRLAFTKDSNFVQDKNVNIDGALNFINNEYIYKIKVNVLPNKSYYVKFNLFEK